jgi:hypothetical protein
MFPSSNILCFEVYLDRKYFDNVDVILGWNASNALNSKL